MSGCLRRQRMPLAVPSRSEPRIVTQASEPAIQMGEQQSSPDWEAYAEGAYLVALGALRDPSLAEDVAQEAVARAIAAVAARHKDAISNLGGFVYGIARHLIADSHRKSGRTTALTAATEISDNRADALSAAVSEEQQRTVHAALQRLSQADRNVLYLCFFEGLEPAEIANRTGEPPERVRKRKSRALERLRQIFLREPGHEPDSKSTGE